MDVVVGRDEGGRSPCRPAYDHFLSYGIRLGDRFSLLCIYSCGFCRQGVIAFSISAARVPSLERKKRRLERHLYRDRVAALSGFGRWLVSQGRGQSYSAVIQTPNKAPEPTTMAVTIRAPSSTARAS